MCLRVASTALICVRLLLFDVFQFQTCVKHVGEPLPYQVPGLVSDELMRPLFGFADRRFVGVGECVKRKLDEYCLDGCAVFKTLRDIGSSLLSVFDMYI